VEKRAPIGLAVLTVLLVVGAGYAAWHYLPREQSVVSEKVPPVPDRLLASRPAGSARDRRGVARTRCDGAGNDGRAQSTCPGNAQRARHLPRRPAGRRLAGAA